MSFLDSEWVIIFPWFSSPSRLEQNIHKMGFYPQVLDTWIPKWKRASCGVLILSIWFRHMARQLTPYGDTMASIHANCVTELSMTYQNIVIYHELRWFDFPKLAMIYNGFNEMNIWEVTRTHLSKSGTLPLKSGLTRPSSAQRIFREGFMGRCRDGLAPTKPRPAKKTGPMGVALSLSAWLECKLWRFDSS